MAKVLLQPLNYINIHPTSVRLYEILLFWREQFF